MARWEIRIMEQPPLVVETDIDLDASWLAFTAKKKRSHKDRQWNPLPGVVVDCRIVLGVLRKGRAPSPSAQKRIGFTANRED